MAKCGDEVLLKTICREMIIGFFSIDSKLLEERVNQLDFTKKANIKKIMIELQNQEGKGHQMLNI